MAKAELPLVEVVDLGMIDYKSAWDVQTDWHQKLIQQKRQGALELPSKLFVCQHPPVFTLGKSGKEDHVLWDKDEREQQGVEFYKINRGGDITYHGPGQLVVYPVFDLDQFFRDVHKYVRNLEEVVLLTLRDFGIEGIRVKEYTGVWLEGMPQRKICAIGVHLSRWVSMHGLALNVKTNLQHFNGIIPCGIGDEGKTVTSMQEELQKDMDLNIVQERLIHHFKDIFEFETVQANEQP